MLVQSADASIPLTTRLPEDLAAIMPTSKMAKTSASTSAPSVSTEAKKGRKKRNLNTITTLPAELISLIMQDLDPKTILNVARTNKFFRNTLVPMKALWVAKLKEIGAPEPPRGVPEHVWLRMLATTNCCSCGKPNVKIDIHILRRLCRECMLSSCSYSTAPSPLSPPPSTLRTEAINYVPTMLRGKFQDQYFLPELEAVEKRLTVLSRAVHDGKPNAQKRLDEFKAQRITLVVDCQLIYPRLSQWISLEEAMKKERAQAAKEARVQLIRQRFYDLGIYNKTDVDTAVQASELKFSKAAKVTDKAWATYRTTFEPAVIEARESRHKGIRDIRTLNICLKWNMWRNETFQGNTSKALRVPSKFPNKRDVLHPLVAELQDVDPELDISPERYNDLATQFPTILHDLEAQRFRRLHASLPQEMRLRCEKEGIEPLDLAVAIFPVELYEGYGISAFIVTRDAHLLWPNFDDLPTFSYPLGVAACSLVSMCGLDPETTLATEMDERGEWFICNRCTYIELVRTSGRRPADNVYIKAFSWRSAIKHICDIREGCSKHDFSFRLLTSIHPLLKDHADECTATAQREVLPTKKVWRCNHCIGVYSLGWDVKQNVTAHLISRHGIANPVDGTDIILDEIMHWFSLFPWRVEVGRPLVVAATGFEEVQD
ncbi:hypothetical protein D9611_008441 [Ephemerocybe angulata]|uniref:F-box domain-containing protein n=1 Tax=Ephemerocybe angulata TaxID=980116 RepID=A0A8H5BII0_9AGAR|nr:hypothetical protein D9611_008441 [Tulosesus angulatus]